MYKVMVPGPDGLRAVTTDAGESMLGSTCSTELEIKSLNVEDQSFWAIASTQNADREGDILEAKGWDLANYLKSPIGLWSHDSWSPPIFKSLETKVVKKQMLFQPKFHDSEFASFIFDLYRQSYMKAFSVGFRYLEWEWIKEVSDEGIAHIIGRRGKRMELFEISAVNVGANSEALAQIKAAGGVVSPYEDAPTPVHRGFYLVETEHASKGVPFNLVDIGGGVFKEIEPDEGLVLGYRFSETEWNPTLVHNWSEFYPERQGKGGTKLNIERKGGVTVPKPEKIIKEEEKTAEIFAQAKSKLDEVNKILAQVTDLLGDKEIEVVESVPIEEQIKAFVEEVTASTEKALKGALEKVAEEVAGVKQAIALAAPQGLEGDPNKDESDPNKDEDGITEKDFLSSADAVFGGKLKAISEDLKSLINGVSGKLDK